MSLTDQDTIAQAQKQMQKCALELQTLAQDVADAKTVKEFSSDRLKRAFSGAVSEFLGAGDGLGASEHQARASTAYGAHLADLELQYKEAMRVIEKHDAIKIMFESARSILSTEKAKLGLL